MDLNLNAAEIDDHASLFEDGLALDSISMAEFIDQIEQHFGVMILDEDLDMSSFSALDRVAALVSQRLNDQQEMQNAVASQTAGQR